MINAVMVIALVLTTLMLIPEVLSLKLGFRKGVCHVGTFLGYVGPCVLILSPLQVQLPFTTTQTSNPSSALVLTNEAQAKSTDTASLGRFDLALKELQTLDRNWDSIVKDQGDNVRRKLGTVYAPPKCMSPLCSFSSFTQKFVQDNYDDIDSDAFELISTEYLESLNQADFLAYSSNFAEYGNGGATCDDEDKDAGDSCKRVSYLDQSRRQVQRAEKAMKDAVDFLNK